MNAVDGQVRTGRAGPVLVVTLDRPARRNAMTLAMAEQLEQAMNQLDTDPQLRVGIITGAGGYFCAGQDLGEAVAGTFARTRDRGWFGVVGRVPAKPLIAAVEGFALAGGLELALSCDLVVAARDARFGVPEIHNGQVAAAGALIRLPLRLPYHVAAGLALTGDPVEATIMHQHGLVTALAEPGTVMEKAVKLAERVHANPPGATARTLDILRVTARTAEAAAWAHQNAVLSTYAMASDPEYAEGVSAFLEKRPPSWRA
jgi:enoyl-CoA hydratase/carnithine racemase